MGYCKDRKEFRVYKRDTKHVIKSRNVTFIEHFSRQWLPNYAAQLLTRNTGQSKTSH